MLYNKTMPQQTTKAGTARDLTTGLIYGESYELTGSVTSLIGGILGLSVPSGEHI